MGVCSTVITVTNKSEDMGKVIGFIKKQPTLATALVSLFAAVVGMFVDKPAVASALVTVFAVLLGVNHVVTPVSTMVEKVTDATTIAATETAKQLGRNTVGAVGEIVDGGSEVVETVIDLTLGKVLHERRID